MASYSLLWTVQLQWNDSRCGVTEDGSDRTLDVLWTR
jgi:hypothetical protein